MPPKSSCNFFLCPVATCVPGRNTIFVSLSPPIALSSRPHAVVSPVTTVSQVWTRTSQRASRLAKVCSSQLCSAAWLLVIKKDLAYAKYTRSKTEATIHCRLSIVWALHFPATLRVLRNPGDFELLWFDNRAFFTVPIRPRILNTLPFDSNFFFRGSPVSSA